MTVKISVYENVIGNTSVNRGFECKDISDCRGCRELPSGGFRLQDATKDTMIFWKVFNYFLIKKLQKVW